MGVTQNSFVWILVVGVCMNAAYTLAWGTYVCDLKEQGLQKIEEICSKSANKLQSPLSALENKLERVLDFVEEIKTAEDSWLHVTKKTGMVERDLSLHEESNPNEGGDEDRRREEQETSDQDDDNKERDQSRQETNENRNRKGERTRTEDDYRQEKRERTNEDDWQNRTERTNEDDWQNRRQRTNGNDRQNRMEQRGDDEDTRRNLESREKPEENDDDDEDAVPKKGECVTQTMDIHETIGMFYMMSYQHGHCSNRNPIAEPVRYCLGFCTSRTFIDREAGNWSQGSDCKSCQATKFETIRIPLACDDGFTFEKKFKNVVNCSCRRCQTMENQKRRP